VGGLDGINSQYIVWRRNKMTKITEKHIGWLFHFKDDPKYILKLEKLSGTTHGWVNNVKTGKKGTIFLDHLEFIELKPVNENCLFKEVLVSDDKENWESMILIGKSTYADPEIDHNCWYVAQENYKTEFGYDSTEEYDYAKRCPDVIYGDENE